MNVAGVLLAAGLSRRFGNGDKLYASLHGLPLGLHAARTLSALALDHYVVVARQNSLVWPGFETVLNAEPEAGMGHSLALGVARARQKGADAVLVVLADMPFVSSTHLKALVAKYVDTSSRIATGQGVARMPPALFGSDWFADLERLSGDVGAKHLLIDAPALMADPAQLIDVDSEIELAAANRG